MRRVLTTLALALCLFGCDSKAPPGESVPLLTGSLGCYAGGEGGPTALLVVDPMYGTSFGGRPVMWPSGYTARRVGSEVVVLDAGDSVRATTGRTYHISFAYAPGIIPNADVSQAGSDSANAFPAAVDCGYAWDFIDCTGAAAAAQGSPAAKYC